MSTLYAQDHGGSQTLVRSQSDTQVRRRATEGTSRQMTHIPSHPTPRRKGSQLLHRGCTEAESPGQTYRHLLAMVGTTLAARGGTQEWEVTSTHTQRLRHAVLGHPEAPIPIAPADKGVGGGADGRGCSGLRGLWAGLRRRGVGGGGCWFRFSPPSGAMDPGRPRGPGRSRPGGPPRAGTTGAGLPPPSAPQPRSAPAAPRAPVR
jgi:hypothetical protein